MKPFGVLQFAIPAPVIYVFVFVYAMDIVPPVLLHKPGFAIHTSLVVVNVFVGMLVC
jgi:hypothetical protein